MNKEFVSYEIAKELKELGFDEPCFKNSEHKKKCENKIDGNCPLHNIHCGSPNCEIDKTIEPIPLPLYQQVFKWFRNKHKMDSNVLPVFRDKCGYDSFKRDGYTFEIIRIDPCQYLSWSDFNVCAEDRDAENKEFEEDERCLKPSFKTYEEAELACIEHLIKQLDK